MYAISSSVYAWRRVDRVHRADGREADEAASAAAAVVGGGDLDLSRPRPRCVVLVDGHAGEMLRQSGPLW